MRPFLQSLACALLALTLSDSEAPAQDRDSGANPKARVPPQLPPVPPSPIDYFRKLIDATPVEREKLLEGRSAEHRRVLTNNLQSYLSLSASNREMRLRAMELRYHLTPLLQMSATNRAQRLALVPEAYRQEVSGRLALWDRLAPEVQKQIVENGRAIRKDPPVLPPMPPLPPVRTAIPRGYNSNVLAASDTALNRWQTYPEAKRREIFTLFTNLFDQAEPQKQKALAPLSAAERDLMEKALATYRGLTPIQRSSCVNAFKKFADLPLAERRQFLRNAEAWQAMKPEDRERWRHIVSNLPPMPPLPPGFGMPPIPPLPPPRPAASSSLLASNTP